MHGRGEEVRARVVRHVVHTQLLSNRRIAQHHDLELAEDVRGELRDVDVIGDAVEVARLCPSTDFARACARLGLPLEPVPAGVADRDGAR